VLLLTFAFSAGNSAACPAVLFNSELLPRLQGSRSGVRLFAKEGVSFRELPIEVDPIDADGHLLFPKSDAWRRQEMQESDLLLFRVDGWGPRLEPAKDRLPCRGKTVFELQDATGGGFAYLTNCAPLMSGIRFSHPVTFDPGGHRLQSRSYLYRFNPDNYMQSHSVSFAAAANTWKLAALDSRLYIHADVKKFFTMSFDSREIESKMESYRLGPVGNLARISFFLKILFFRIKMSLSTDVGFFEDSAHIPMMVNIPVDSTEYLNPGSGILYSWVPGPNAKVMAVQMPRFDPVEAKKGWRSLGKAPAQFCSKLECAFRYAIDVDGKRLAMDLRFEKKLVERAFYPLYVEDVAQHAEAMGWNLDLPKGQKRSAMYFETSGLPEGGHPWDFWLRLGTAKGSPQSCPAPLRFADYTGKLNKAR
jgi:hypothetical protein